MIKKLSQAQIHTSHFLEDMSLLCVGNNICKGAMVNTGGGSNVMSIISVTTFISVTFPFNPCPAENSVEAN